MLELINSLLFLFGAALMASAILRGRKIKDIVPSELLSRWQTMIVFMLIFLVGNLFLFIILIKHLMFSIELLTGPVFIGGAIFFFIVISLTRDTISRTKSAEEKLQSTNESLKLILESVWEGIFGLDLKGNLTFVNPAAAKMLGYEEEELIGTHGHSSWHHTKTDGPLCQYK